MLTQTDEQYDMLILKVTTQEYYCVQVTRISVCKLHVLLCGNSIKL